MKRPFHTIKLYNNVDIYLESGIINNINDIINSYTDTDNIVIVTDNNVNLLYGDKIKSLLATKHISIIEIQAGETSKNINTILKLYDEFHKLKVGRRDIILALGGGVVGDITGFAAATYMRGIPYIQIPTTLLSQIDSSIGGKTGVDLVYGKNLVGAFYQPKAIIIDLFFLKSLEDKIFNDGLAEAIKYGLIKDRCIFDIIENGIDDKNLSDIVKRCVLIKSEIVEKDEFEKGQRMILNFGHTFGHAIEKCLNFQDITHGAAVGIGMLYATKISMNIGICKNDIYDKIKDVLIKYNLPTQINLDRKDLFNAIKSDKKRINNNLKFICIKDIGEANIIELSIDELEMKL